MQAFRNQIPRILSLSFITVVIGITIYKVRVLETIGSPLIPLLLLFIGSYLLWILLEFKTAKSETQKGTRTADFGTCEVYALGRMLTLLSGLLFYNEWAELTPRHIIAYALFIAGFSFRLYAIHTLGRYYSHIVRKVEGHRIISSGPYRLLRHPAYTGMILANLGVALFFFNPVTVCIYAGILIPAIIIRIRIEERTLYEIEGYESYARHRKRIIPFIW